MDTNKYLCLICEKEMSQVWPNTEIDQISGGGHIEVSFHYGSRYDWIGSRIPISIPASVEALFNKDLTIKRSNLPLDKDIQIASSKHICAYICDDCFKKKIHCFLGKE